MRDESPSDPEIRRTFRLPSQLRGQPQRDVDDELAFHIAMRADKLRAGGIDDANARAEAERLFGDVSSIRSACVEADRDGAWRDRIVMHWTGALHDVRLGARSLRRAPAFTIAAVMLLALGIAGGVAVFSIVNAVAFRPLPYPSAERLAFASVVVNHPDCGGRCARSPAAAEIDAWMRGARSADAIGTLGLRQETARTGDATVILEGAAVSSSLTGMLGVRAAIGRSLHPGDFAPGAPRVLVLGHAAWRSQFGGDSTVLGRTLTLGDASYQIVGVLAPESELGSPIFSFNARTAQYLVPNVDASGRATASLARVIVRVRAGVTLQQLQAELDALLRAGESTSLAGDAAWHAAIEPLSAALAARYRGSYLVLLAAVGVVLLVTCMNVGGLVLARLNDRTPELATHTALGATRFQLGRQLAIEMLLLSTAGGAAGLLLGYYAIQLTRLIPAERLPFWTTVTMDARVVGATVLATSLAALLLAIAPATVLAPRRLLARLRELVSASPSRARTRGVIVALEVMCTVILLVSAGLVVKLLVIAERRDLGFAKLSMVYVLLQASRSGGAASDEWVERVVAQFRRLPGVTAVGIQGEISRRAPVARPSGGASSSPAPQRRGARPVMMIDGQSTPLATGVAPSRATAVSTDFFSAMGTRVVEGRAFSDADGPAAPFVAIVNDATARRLFPGASAVGRRIRFGGADSDEPWLTIVGVVAAMRNDPLLSGDEYDPRLYRPLRQTTATATATSVIVHTAGDAAPMVPSIRRAMAEADPTVPIANILTTEQSLAMRLWPARFNAVVLGTFAAFAALLAALGIYAAVSHAVGRRRREMAVRLALGATRNDVVALVMRAGLRPVAAGLLAGAVGSLAAVRLLRSMLYGTPPFQPGVLGGVALAMLGVATLAAFVPARRAASENPSRALRAE